MQRCDGNPVIEPNKDHQWESEGTFNPAAILVDGTVHLFYRALGKDGISRIGYAVSDDGIHFERLPYPVFSVDGAAQTHAPYTSPARLIYDTVAYASGGGWGGCEDPRAVNLDGTVYLTFNMFNGWESVRVGLAALNNADLARQRWAWTPFSYLSRTGERHKNWVLFPEKIRGKYALLHSVYGENDSRVQVKYMDELTSSCAPCQRESADPQKMPNKKIAWHEHMRSAGAPPLKTKDGWLVFYHANDAKEPHIGYKLGAMLLDIDDPTKIIARSGKPVLEPKEWYENDWKPGVIIASGAVIKDGTLFIYYGGGDKTVNIATANINQFLAELKKGRSPKLTKVAKFISSQTL